MKVYKKTQPKYIQLKFMQENTQPGLIYYHYLVIIACPVYVIMINDWSMCCSLDCEEYLVKEREWEGLGSEYEWEIDTDRQINR